MVSREMPALSLSLVFPHCFCRELTPFGNQARKDGLILKHWHWRDDVSTTTFPTTPADSNAASEEQDDRVAKPATDYLYAKYDIRVDKPIYSEEQYNTKLRSEDWTKDETDYLVDLAYEFDLRWVVIADRYDYKLLNQTVREMQRLLQSQVNTEPWKISRLDITRLRLLQ